MTIITEVEMIEEFLALGRVPGTNYQITFEQLLVLYALGFVYLSLYKKHIALRDLGREVKKYPVSRYLVRFRKLYLFTKKGTQLKLPV